MRWTIYKRLFEVRILHGYYLDYRLADEHTDEPGRFYGLTNEQQAELLATEYNLLNDLEIIPAKATAELMGMQKVRWRPNTTGFFAGIEVQPSGANGLRPIYPMPDGATFTFFLKAKNPNWHNFTSHAVRLPLPAKYLFTNVVEAGDGKVFNSLSRQVPPFNSQRTWEMGELARFGANLRFALKHAPTGVGNFSDVITDRRYASSEDRLALAKQFTYRFDRLVLPANTAVFTLRTTGGALVKTVSLTPSQPGGTLPAEVQVDLRHMDIPPGATVAQPILDGRYQLEVNVNGTAFGTAQTVLLLDELSNDSSVIGVVQIVHNAGRTDAFRLLEPNGDVRAVRIPNTTNRWQNEALFTVRFLSRPTYWTYNLAEANGQNSGDVQQFAGASRLITTKPRHLTRSFQKVAYTANFAQLPNPASPKLDFDAAGERFLSEMYLSLP